MLMVAVLLLAIIVGFSPTGIAAALLWVGFAAMLLGRAWQSARKDRKVCLNQGGSRSKVGNMFCAAGLCFHRKVV